MPVSLPTAILLGAGAAVGTAVYSADKGRKEQSKARDFAREQESGRAARELQAGEHWEELNREQMVLQSQQNQIQLLSDILRKQNESLPPQILTVPAAKSYSAVQRINSAIADIFRRG